MDTGQAMFTVLIFKWLIIGGVFSIWLVWFCYRLLWFIDRNVEYTDPQPTWPQYLRYRYRVWDQPDRDWEPVDRPPYQIGFGGYTVLMLLVIFLAMISC